MRTGGSSATDLGRGRVLVADLVNGRSRSAVAAVRALACGGYTPVVTKSGSGSPAAASRDCAGVVDVPAGSGAGYVAAVELALARSSYVDVLPASDGALLALGLPGAALVDKSALPAQLSAVGLETPESAYFSDGASLSAASKQLEYPLVVKPVLKSDPAEQARRIDGPSALEELARTLSGPAIVQSYLTGRLRAVAGVVHEGHFLALLHQSYFRTWPADCGVASSAITTVADLDLEERLGELLQAHTGVFQVQLIGERVIDVNPRVYGSLPLAVAAGANLPAIACAARQGRVGSLVRGRPGVRYRWLEGDLRSVWHGMRRDGLSKRAAAGALRPRSGTAHSIESIRDPAPLLTRVANVARQALS